MRRLWGVTGCRLRTEEDGRGEWRGGGVEATPRRVGVAGRGKGREGEERRSPTGCGAKGTVGKGRHAALRARGGWASGASGSGGGSRQARPGVIMLQLRLDLGARCRCRCRRVEAAGSRGGRGCFATSGRGWLFLFFTSSGCRGLEHAFCALRCGVVTSTVCKKMHVLRASSLSFPLAQGFQWYFYTQNGNRNI